MPWEAVTAAARAVADRLIEYGRTPDCAPGWPALDPETENLIKGNPFAFLIAVAFDRGMPWEMAFQIPAEIERKGCLDPERLASMSEDELARLLEGLPIRPRYGATEGARTLSDAARLMCGQFDGDAGAIWKDSSPASVEKVLQEIHGLGPGIASMTTRILHDEFDCFRGQEGQIDIKPDTHVLRVFQRAGLIDDKSEKRAIWVARELNRKFPGALDLPAWHIGRKWCRPTRPKCAPCPLTAVFAKRI